MSSATIHKIHEQVRQHRFIPLFNDDDAALCCRVIEAAYKGGARLFEFTNRSAGALEVFKEVRQYSRKHLAGLVLGAGTITTGDEARSFALAGADFVVSPIFDAEVARYCQQHDLYFVAGAATLTEVVHAHRHGAKLVKLFPANLLGGPAFVQAIKAPCPWIEVMPTGGVDTSEENLKAWFKAGVTCVGLGSRLFGQDLISAGNYAGITQQVESVVTIIRKLNPHGGLV